MSNKRCLTKKIPRHKREYTVYKGDDIIAFGTANECAEILNVQVEYIEWMVTPTAKRRLEKRKDPQNAVTAVRVDDGVKDDEL